MDNNFSFNYFNYFSDISYGNISYAYRLNNRGHTLHFGLMYINYGDFSGYDELGNYTGEFTGNEGCFSTSYSLKLRSFPIYFGTSVKIISSRLEQYNSYALATDIGAFYYDNLNDLNISLVFRNIGYQIKIWDFDFACIPGIVDNKKVTAEWTNRINVNCKKNQYYDIHFFFNTLTKKGFFPQFWTSDSITKQ